ncbi:MAG: alcohol dehydrogenase, partial [Chloroflexota bacterium]
PVPGGGPSRYAPNITADPEQGIGAWSEGDFLRALRDGVAPQGRLLDPAMPRYAQMNADDLRAIYLYLRTLPAR